MHAPDGPAPGETSLATAPATDTSPVDAASIEAAAAAPTAATTQAIAPTPVTAAGAPPESHEHDGVWPARALVRSALLFLAALVACVLGYLAYAIPGSWFPAAHPIAFPASQLALTRGTGQLVAGELAVTAPDPAGLTIVSVVSNLRASDYAGIAWVGIGFAEQADVRLLWRTSYAPERLNSIPIRVESSRLTPVVVANNPQWIGTITGVALAVRGPLTQPISIRGVVAKPMGASETLQDRLREWLAFESWSGTSINALSGGAEVQDLPLPLLLGVTAAVAAALAALLVRWRPSGLRLPLPTALAAFFILGWLLLDLRWTGNLVVQERATGAQFGGKSLREKHLASQDAGLFAFIERAREVMPATPARVFVAADADYFRGRAAYHLYPHSVFAPRGNDLPNAADLRPGDWLLVYLRRGMQYDPARHMLRWDGQTASADLKLADPGAALFLIR